MNKILSLQDAIKVSQEIRTQGKTIVLVGGCFDILHHGHRIFLERAKMQGDSLFVVLESDENVRRLKGSGRPINAQKKRAENLLAIGAIDYIILLPTFAFDKDYTLLTKELSPKVIAITSGDPKQREKEKQAKSVGGKVAVVTKILENYSTTQILKGL